MPVQGTPLLTVLQIMHNKLLHYAQSDIFASFLCSYFPLKHLLLIFFYEKLFDATETVVAYKEIACGYIVFYTTSFYFSLH